MKRGRLNGARAQAAFGALSRESGQSKRRRGESGFAMLLVFVMAATIAITLYIEVPRIAFESQRSREQMAIDRGLQYKRAIQLFYRKYQTYPQTLDDLETKRNFRFLRSRYLDPLTGKEWRLLHVGPAGQLTDSLVQPPAPLPGSSRPASALGSSPASGSSQTASTQSSNAPQPVDPNNPNGQALPDPLNMAARRPSDRIIGSGPAGGNGGDAGVEQPPEPDPNQPQEPAQPIQQPVPVQQPFAGQSPFPGQPVQQPADPNEPQDPQEPQIPGQPFVPGQQPIPGQPAGPQDPSQPAQPPVQFPPGLLPPGAGQGQPLPGTPGFQQTPGAPAGPPFGQPPFGQAPFGQTPGPAAGPPFGQPPFGQPVGRTPGGAPAQQSAAGLIQQILTTPRQPPSSIPGFTSGNTGGIAGVASTADGKGIHVINDHSKYKEWEFVYDLKKDKTVVGAAAVNQQQQMQQQIQQNQNGTTGGTFGGTSPFGSSNTFGGNSSSPFSSTPTNSPSPLAPAAPTTPPPSQ